MSIAIEFNNISKQYRLGLVSTRTLSHDLNRWWTTNILGKEDPYLKIGELNDRSTKGESEYVWALTNIDFKVEQGDVLGIIGKNGAGKSTLLKILSKVTAPTTGSIRARGRIASLLEVGTGFHPEMTGRENIYMNGAIMGMTKYEISRKLDEIIDFSGCERYIDTPTKRYSSGMTVRLGFAIAAHLEPEILVVDEVLAVGDAEFQKKAIGKMHDVSKGEGRTVLFVSHNMSSMRQLCTSGVLLDSGVVSYAGNISDTVDRYLKESKDLGGEIVDHIKINSGALKIDRVTINGGVNSSIILSNMDNRVVDFEVVGSIYKDERIAVEAQLRDANNLLLASYCPSHISGDVKTYKQGRIEIKERIILPKNLCNGEYYLFFQLTDPYVIYLCEFEQPIKLTVSGFSGKSAIPLDYRDRGMLILNNV